MTYKSKPDLKPNLSPLTIRTNLAYLKAKRNQHLAKATSILLEESTLIDKLMSVNLTSKESRGNQNR